jgi:hypothetical protein
MDRTRIFSALLFCLLLVASLTGPARAASSGYTLTWASVAGGGGTSTASAYSLSGSTGQAAAGPLSAGAYQLSAGFWLSQPGGSRQNVFLPLITR